MKKYLFLLLLFTLGVVTAVNAWPSRGGGSRVVRGMKVLTPDIGIGISNPQADLHIYNADAGTDPSWTTGDDIVIVEAATNAEIALFSADGHGGVHMASPSGRFRAGFFYNSTNGMDFYSGNSARVRITTDGHISVTGTAPALTSCGTTPTIVGAHNAGKITIGTGTITSCTATFDVAFVNAPACTVAGDNTAVTYAATTSTTVLTITSSADMATDVISYICIGQH